MIGSIAKSKNASEKNKMRFKNLKFFVSSSKNRLQKIKSGCRLVSVINQQREENEEPLDIIDNYLQMEKGALKLIKASRGLEDNKAENSLKRKQKGITSTQAQPEDKQQPGFDFQEYFKTKQFNAASEIQKERDLENFFRQRYELESKGLAEENLKNFLELSSEPMNKWDTSRGAYGSKEESNQLGANTKEKSKEKDSRAMDIREHILTQMKILDEEIRKNVINEIQAEKKKISLRKGITENKIQHSKLSTDSPAILMNSTGTIRMQNSGMKSRISDTEDEASRSLLMPNLVNKIEKLYHGDLKETKQITRTKKIISDLLDHGRKDFLKSHKLPKTPKDFQATGIQGLINSKQLASSAGFKLESIFPFTPTEAQPTKAINNLNLYKIDTAKSASTSKRLPQATNLAKISMEQSRQRLSMYNEFNRCKLFQICKTANNFFSRAEAIKQDKSELGGVAPSKSNIDSLRCMYSKSGASPATLLFNEFPNIQSPKTVSNFLSNNPARGESFFQRVQSDYLNMKGIWSPEHSTPSKQFQ